MKSILIATLVLVNANFAFAKSFEKIKTAEVGGQDIQVIGNLFGQTLYTFDPDTLTSSNCNGACAEKWPPYLITQQETTELGEGLGFITRATGLLQLTYQKKPVYTFFQDRDDEDAYGSELGNVWHVIRAD